MHFITPRDQLNTVLQICQRAVSLRSPLPILSCFYFDVTQNSLTVTATDLEFGIRCTLPVTTVIEGQAAVPSKYVTNFFTRLPDVDIDVKFDATTNTATFAYGDSELVLNGYPADEFPNFPSLPQNPSLFIEQDIFKKMLKQVLFAVSSEEQRPLFSGVHICLTKEGILSMVATDTRRLAVSNQKINITSGETINIIVPGKTLNELYKLLEADEEKFSIYITENQVFFTINNFCLMSRLIAGQYPDYRVVIPNQYVCEVRASVSDLLETAERVSLLVSNQRKVFSIGFQPENLLIYFYTETGRIREELAVLFTGDPLEVGFNVKFFIDTLKAIDSKEVLIKLSGQDSPALFQPVDDDNYFSILVPAVS